MSRPGQLHELTGTVRDYAWGSPTRIPEFLGSAPTAATTAELWFGAHPSAPSPLAGTAGDLREHIEADPGRTLGEGVLARFGEDLPYLLKLIAPASPLSLQVHPNLEQARTGFAHRQAPGGSPDYVDANHKPELLYALSRFEAVCGFRAPRRAAELFSGLESPLAREVVGLLRHKRPRDGVRAAFELVLTDVEADDVAAIAAECTARLAAGASPSRRSDAIVDHLARRYPSDPGVVASLLLNPVTLKPGEAMFVPAGSVHAYLDGFGVELMANSDNVLRAGLTPKNVDVPGVLAIVDYIGAPPIRLAPEELGPRIGTYYAPVDDFELSVADAGPDPAQLPGKGPRILLGIEGEVTIRCSGSAAQDAALRPGRAVFIDADVPAVQISGAGRIVQADVP